VELAVDYCPSDFYALSDFSGLMAVSGTCFVVAGLALDIFGAVLIAIPDVPRLSELVGAGALKRAREQMEAGGVTMDDAGFSGLDEILAEIEPTANHGAENGGQTYSEIIVNSKVGLAASNIDFKWGEEYVEARYKVGAGHKETDFYPVGDVYRAVRSRIRSQTTRIRASGLFLLTVGFTLQLLGTVV
jgi:hypothetical protein